jgi:hypothetical protein
MKNLIAILSLSFLGRNSGFANEGKFIEVMQKNIQALYAAQSSDDLQHVINTLDRIASSERTKWEPFYYMSFGYILMATREKEGAKKDVYLDLAKTALDKASSVKKDDSEIIALEGFIIMIRISADPGTRGPQLAGLAVQNFEKALSINTGNPRALALLAQMQFGTAKFFNQAPTDACANAAKALTLFNGQNTNNPLAPIWGKDMTEELTKNCK